MDKTPQELTGNLLRELTAPLGPPTKEKPVNIKDWAKFLALETCAEPALERLVETCAKFCRRIKDGQKPSWISMLGSAGSGKTHCARKMWFWARKRFDWRFCEFLDEEIYWPEMVGRLRDIKDTEGKSKLRDMAKWPILFLDDVGAERDTTGFAGEQLNALLGQRVGKWTILTSNLVLEQLAAIDVRISDRIIREDGNEFIEIDTTSYGLRKLKGAPKAAEFRQALPPGDRE